MDYRRYMMMLSLLTVAVVAMAQVEEDKKRLHVPDSVKNDYEEWLRNEPVRPEPEEGTAIAPLPPSGAVVDPQKLQPKHPDVSINIMTPALRQDMQLAYQGHWLEEQRKSQAGGAMTAGVSPLSLIGYVLRKIFPKRKSRKERDRERIQWILDNY